MKRYVLICLIFQILFISSNVCLADVYTTKISPLNAERFVQEYNKATYKEHGNIGYFVKPELATPSSWGKIWPYDLWKSISVDSMYQLELTTDKKGYVTKIEVICAYGKYRTEALKIVTKMLDTSCHLSQAQIKYFIKNIKTSYDREGGKYYISDIAINTHAVLALLMSDKSPRVIAFGRSPYD